MHRIRGWLAGLSLPYRLAAVAIALLGGLALGFGVLRAASTQLQLQPQEATATATATALRQAPGATPTAVPTPGPTATMPSVSLIGARVRVFPRVGQLDLTLGGSQAPQAGGAKSLVYTPDPKYVAEDTLTDTGPGPPGPLSGLPTRPELARRRPVAVVIDNFDPDARPQAGLNRASVVFETVAEGGITRFMAVYLEKDAPIVGPVRSARIYFDAWADGLHAIYAHAGGNNDAMKEIARLRGIANVDGLRLQAPNPYPWDLYWRSNDRVAPHNLFTATDHLRAYADVTGAASGTVPIASLPHKEPSAVWVRPHGGSIGIGFSGDSYSVQYRYDPRCNCYPRSMNGAAHADEFSLKQIAPSNVVVLYAGVLADPASDTPGSVNVQTRGSGRALYFRDGAMVQGFWHKDAVDAPLTLLDAQGRPVALNPGQTWFEVVPIGNPVNWQLHG